MLSVDRIDSYLNKITLNLPRFFLFEANLWVSLLARLQTVPRERWRRALKDSNNLDIYIKLFKVIKMIEALVITAIELTILKTTDYAVKSYYKYKDNQKLNKYPLPKTHFNPYIVGKHVSGEKFIGRQNILTDLLAGLKAGNHLLIEGERRIGKTSVLHQLAKLLREDQDYYFIPAYVQLQRVTEERLFYAIMRALARESRRHYDQLPALLCEARYDGYDSFDAEDDLHTIVDTFKEQTDLPLRVVILLDEGDRLREFSEDVHGKLRGWMGADQQDVLLVVWCGVSFDKAWHKKTSPWYNQFRSSLELPPLSPKAAKELITRPAGDYYTYEEEAIFRILALSERKPFVIQLICDECVKVIWRRHSSALITLLDVNEVWPLVKERLESDAKAEMTAQEESE